MTCHNIFVIPLGLSHALILKLTEIFLLLLIEVVNQINSTYNTDENKYDTCCRDVK